MALTRRALIATGAGATLAASLPRLASPARAAPALEQARQSIILNDASGLNPTPVATHWLARPDPEEAFIARLRADLKRAKATQSPLVVGTARHSMGGQSLARGATAITLEGGHCEPDRAASTYRVQAGARWRDVIRTLDPIGFSPVVMQSNHDFGVGSSFCVNAHGWPAPHGPFGSTVRAVRLMLADGEIVRCAPDENAELLTLAMGGYGLLGIVLDLEVEMVPNILLKPRFEVLPARRFGERFASIVEDDAAIRMAFGRVSVARRNVFEEAEIVTFRPVAVPPSGMPKLEGGGALLPMARVIYRAQVGSEAMKRARWYAETHGAPLISPRRVTRNRLLNTPVAGLAGRDPGRTDILHEYFVPPERFADFAVACRDVIRLSGQDLLNVTLRYVCTDAASVLAYAPEPRIGAVMAFSQKTDAAGEAGMARMTEALIERVLALGGTFYLPYRLHARRDQVERGYPNLARFIERKRHYDPGLLFRNMMWERYFGG